MEYHEKAKSKKKRMSKDSKEPRKMQAEEVKPEDGKVESVENVEKAEEKLDETVDHVEFLSASYIEKHNLSPKEVLNIKHIKGQEKKLVAMIKFDGADEPAYVYSKWANKHCPQLVIAFYEKRVRWDEKS